MMPELYDNILSIVQRYRTWIQVVEERNYVNMYVAVDGILQPVPTQVLTIRSYAVKWGVVMPRTWHIPLTDLDRAVHCLTRQKAASRPRVKACDLTLHDVEIIFEEATHGLIKLCLGRYGLR